MNEGGRLDSRKHKGWTISVPESYQLGTWCQAMPGATISECLEWYSQPVMPLLKNLQWLPLPLRQSLDSLTWHSRPGCFPLSLPHSFYPSLPSTHPSIHLPTHPSFHASIPLSTYPPIHPSFHPIFIECLSCSR